ncbi:MAG: acyl-CoA thioesterase [Anaerolineae bacterium]
MAFEHLQRIRFHQCDPAGVLFYGRVFEVVESAYEELCRAAGLDIQALMDQEVHTTPIVRAEADYLSPVRVGEEVTVRAVVERLGGSSIHIAYSIVGADGTERIRAKVVHVFVAADGWSTTEIPPDVRAAYLRFAAD